MNSNTSITCEKASNNSLSTTRADLATAAWALAILLLAGVATGATATQAGRGDASTSELLGQVCGLAGHDAARWHSDRRLDEAAASWARGATLHDAIERSGYTASAVSGVHVENASASRGPAPEASTCRTLRDASLIDAGTYQRGADAWIVLAAPIVLPAMGDEDRVHERALELVNRARASLRRCGSHEMPPAAPLRLSEPLNDAANDHARDMARHHYFEHQDREGRTPADRVRAAGYAEIRVGENIAYGTLSTDDAIAGWLESAGHCENLMDPGFQQMGIAFARERGAGANVYWVQVLAAPKPSRR
jgi:uncharacterized protein YkwD